MTNYIDIAQMYVDEGFNPIPLKQDKSPALAAGLNFLYEKMSVDERYVSYGIGLTCGIASDGLECIDFDRHQGQDIETVFKGFITDPQAADILKNNPVALYKTPSGGNHIIFRCKYTTKTTVLAKYDDGEVMIEVRAGGAYIAVEPTPGYELIGGVELMKIGHIDRADRDYLLNLARTMSRVPVEVKKQGEMKGLKWGNWDDKTPWGKFNIEYGDQVTKLLERAGWALVSERIRARENMPPVQLWRRPGKQSGISASFGQYPNMFYCFTSSKEAAPFEQNKGYTPTDILMLLHFKGDWNKTKEHLYKRFDMKPKVAQIVQFDEEGALPFPLEVFPPAVIEFITELNRTLNYKIDFLAAGLMFAVATLNGNKYKLRVKNGWIAATTFWFAVVGDSGVMKSHPLNTMVRPIKVIDKDEYEVFVQQMQVLAEEDAKARKPIFRQILIEDFTLEAVHAIHRNNPRGLGLHKDELVGFLRDMNKYRNGSDEQFWLESFNNSSYIVNRVTKDPVYIENIMVNIIGSIQPQVLSTVAVNSDGNGLIERFLYTSSESNVYPLSMEDIDPEWLKWWEDVLRQMHTLLPYAHKENTLTLQLSHESLQQLIAVDKELCKLQMQNTETAKLKNYLNKMKTYMPRFALLLWLIDGFMDRFSLDPAPLSVEYIIRAKKLVEYFISSAKKVFNDGEIRDEINTVGRSLKAKGMSKAEQIIVLSEKGFRQVDIASMLKTPASYVSKTISEKRG